MTKVLVSGCNGFIGSYICEELLKHDYNVFGFDNNSKYKFPNIDFHSNNNFCFNNLDLINDYPILKFWMQKIKPDIIIHCAAKIGGIKYFHENAFDLIRDNAIMDSNILDLAIKCEVNKFVGLSSSMVYENATVYPTPEEHLKVCPPPSSTYGFSKLSLEYKIKGAYEQYKLPYIIIRPFNAVGPNENDFMEGKQSHVLPDLIVKCLNKQNPLHILGNGTQTRCFTNGKDIARGIRLAIESDVINEDFNISNSESTTVLKLASKIWDKINKDILLSGFVCDAALQYDVQMRIPDVSKAKKLLNFETEISLDESIDETVEYITKYINLKNVQGV